MNKAYRQVLKEYQADGLFIRKVRAAQRAWVVYRDAHLESLYPASDPQREYGSVNPVSRCLALKELTLERTQQLRRWTRGIAEGDVCAGSIKTMK